MALIIVLFILVIVQGVTSETCYANADQGTQYPCSYGCCHNVCCDATTNTKPVVIGGITIACFVVFLGSLKLIWICIERTSYCWQRRYRRQLSESCTDTTQDNGSINNEANQNNNNASAHSTLPLTYANLESYGYNQPPTNHKNGLSKY